MTQRQYTAYGLQNGPDLIATLDPSVYTRALLQVFVKGPAGSTAEVYNGNYNPNNLVESTRVGESDTSFYNPGKTILPGQSVTVRWPGVTGGALASFMVEEP